MLARRAHWRSRALAGKIDRDPLAASDEARRGVTRTRAKVHAARRAAPSTRAPESVVIVGAGAAGNASAEMLRRLGYAGRITMLGAEPDSPYDRPNLSKDYLAGNAPEEWIPLRPPGFHAEHGIDLVHTAQVSALDLPKREVQLAGGRAYTFDRLLLATGAEPVRLSLPGGDRAHVHYLRSLADSRAIIANTATGEARGRHRRELHRPRGRGLAAQAGDRGARRRAGDTAARARDGYRARRSS